MDHLLRGRAGRRWTYSTHRPNGQCDRMDGRMVVQWVQKPGFMKEEEITRAGSQHSRYLLFGIRHLGFIRDITHCHSGI